MRTFFILNAIEVLCIVAFIMGVLSFADTAAWWLR